MVGCVMKIITSTKEANTEVIGAKKETTTDYIAARQKRRPWWNCELSIFCNWGRPNCSKN